MIKKHYKTQENFRRLPKSAAKLSTAESLQ